MPDNILTKDRDDANISLAAKDVSGILHPRNILTDPSGNDITPAGEVTLASVLTAVNELATAISQHDEVATDGHGGFVILAKRRDSDSSAMVQDGDFGYISLDENQRLKVATQPASVDVSSGSITANGQNVSIKCGRFGNIAVSMVATSLVGHNSTFECSNNSTTGTDGNWYSVQAVRSNANTVETTTGTMTATPVYMWHVNVGDYGYFRVRATSHTSGTAAYILKPGAYATEPIPAVQVTGTQPISGTVTANVGGATLAIPLLVADVASAAITTTTTTSAITPSAGVSYSLVVPVTAVSGTSPTLDIVAQESDDSGTNWMDIYHFPRITATGVYRSPTLKLRGNRVRYVQTITGTTPSFTRSINRLQRQCSCSQYSQLIDRSISLTTLNAVTASLDVKGIDNVQILINLGTAATPPALQIEGSEDNLLWYAIGSPLTASASATVSYTVNNVSPAFVRAKVSTAGVTVVAGYILLRAY